MRGPRRGSRATLGASAQPSQAVAQWAGQQLLGGEMLLLVVVGC